MGHICRRIPRGHRRRGHPVRGAPKVTSKKKPMSSTAISGSEASIAAITDCQRRSPHSQTAHLIAIMPTSEGELAAKGMGFLVDTVGASKKQLLAALSKLISMACLQP